MTSDRIDRIEQKVDSLALLAADLRVAVARIEERQAGGAAKPGLARDGALTISGSALGGAILFLLQHFTGK